MRRIVCLLAIAAAATPAIARHHERSSAHSSRAAKTRAKPPAAPAGVTTVPAAGLKLYCAGRKSPLLVRKFTQGSGTTVTALCR